MYSLLPKEDSEKVRSHIFSWPFRELTVSRYWRTSRRGVTNPRLSALRKWVPSSPQTDNSSQPPGVSSFVCLLQSNRIAKPVFLELWHGNPDY
jgi:hypothetical protein